MRTLLLFAVLSASASDIPRFRPEFAEEWRHQCVEFYAEAMGAEVVYSVCECMVAGGNGRFTERDWAKQTEKRRKKPFKANKEYEAVWNHCVDTTVEFDDYLRARDKARARAK